MDFDRDEYTPRPQQTRPASASTSGAGPIAAALAVAALAGALALGPTGPARVAGSSPPSISAPLPPVAPVAEAPAAPVRSEPVRSGLELVQRPETPAAASAAPADSDLASLSAEFQNAVAPDAPAEDEAEADAPKPFEPPRLVPTPSRYQSGATTAAQAIAAADAPAQDPGRTVAQGVAALRAAQNRRAPARSRTSVAQLAAPAACPTNNCRGAAGSSAALWVEDLGAVPASPQLMTVKAAGRCELGYMYRVTNNSAGTLGRMTLTSTGNERWTLGPIPAGQSVMIRSRTPIQRLHTIFAGAEASELVARSSRLGQ